MLPSKPGMHLIYYAVLFLAGMGDSEGGGAGIFYLNAGFSKTPFQ